MYVIVEQSVLSNLGDIPFSTIGYPWVTQKQWKAALLSPSDIKNYLLETLMLNLIFLIHPSLQIFCKIQTGAFSISRFLVKSLVNKNCLTRELVLMLIWNLDWFLNFMKKNSLTLKKNDKDVILTKYDALVIFLIQGWVGLIWKQFQMHGLLFLSFHQ